MNINAGSTILFQGDSITDSARNREILDPMHSAALGCGYVSDIAARVLCERPADGLRFVNRGVSGNRVVDLYARWKGEAINLQPELISILIGVNDTWHDLRWKDGVEPERYELVYRLLLDYTRNQLPNTQIVLCEPFVLVCGDVTAAWEDDMAQRRAIVRSLAAEFDACFVPFQSVLDAALERASADYWLRDGVHPTVAGHRLLADCWYDTVIGKA